jgi:hypothetical protein
VPKSTKRKTKGALPEPQASYFGSFLDPESLGVEIYKGRNIVEGILNRGTRRPPKETIKDARRFAEQNWMISLILWLKTCFFNYGVKVKEVKQTAGNASNNGAGNVPSEEFLNWWGENGENAGQNVLNYIDEVWQEWLTVRNVISYWNNWVDRAIVLYPEDHHYDDTFGIERFWVHHGLTTTQLDAKDAEGRPLFADRLRQLLRASAEVECTGDNGLSFKCLKRQRMGKGLATPDLESVLSACTCIESLESGDNVLGQEARRLMVQHVLGHEVKYGPQAGGTRGNITAQRKQEVEKGVKGKLGRVEMWTNWDQKVVYNYLDPKFFEGKKYSGSEQHLMYWGAPLTFMLQVQGGVAPFLMDILRTQAIGERQKVGPYLNTVINQAFALPAGMRVMVTWSERVFKESRLASDLLKIGLASGPVSQQTFREEGGWDNEQEEERKKREAKLDKGVTYPIYDSSHGAPGASAQKGRPVGQPDEGKTGP